MIKVRFNPPDNEAGIVSFATWESTPLQDALRAAFGAGDHEELVQVDITADGIKGYFEIRGNHETESRD